MSYFFPAKTNHRRVRSELMKIAMRKLSQGSITGRRAVEGVTHILKGATYLPQFNNIPLDTTSGIVTAKQAAAISGKARGLRKGALWCTALHRAGIPVTLDYYDPATANLPDIMDTMIAVCVEVLEEHLTQEDINMICHVFGLPIEAVGPAGWTEAHDVLAAQGIVEGNPTKIEAAFAHANGEIPDMTIEVDHAAAASYAAATKMEKASNLLPDNGNLTDLAALIEQAVASKLAAMGMKVELEA